MSSLTITLNGKRTLLSSAVDLAHFIALQKVDAAYIAVELNGCIVPKSQWAQAYLTDGDVLELVTAIGGG